MNAAVVVLAAGAGTRLGWGPKGALVAGDGRTLAQRAVDAVRGAGARAVLVSGAVDLEAHGAVVVPAPDWATGLAASLRAGVAATHEPVVGVVLADEPGIGAAVITRVLAAHAPGTITAAAFAGVRGHPVVMDAAEARAASAAARDDRGWGPWLRAEAARVRLVECGDVGRPGDVDTPADARWWGVTVARVGRSDHGQRAGRATRRPEQGESGALPTPSGAFCAPRSPQGTVP